MVPATARKCSRCFQVKPASDFYADRGRPRSNCIACHQASRRDHYRRAKNGETTSESEEPSQDLVEANLRALEPLLERFRRLGIEAPRGDLWVPSHVVGAIEPRRLGLRFYRGYGHEGYVQVHRAGGVVAHALADISLGDLATDLARRGIKVLDPTDPILETLPTPGVSRG